MTNFTEIANHIWKVADLLRGSFKQHEYESIILPFTVIRLWFPFILGMFLL